MGALLAFLVRRVALGAAVVVTVAVLTYGLIRVLRPDLFPGEGLAGGVADDLRRVFIHFDLGEACMFAGCPPISRLWKQGMGADVSLLCGAFALGVAGGVAGGVWCASHPRSRRARLLEATAMLFLCTPVYVVGLGLLLLLTPTFGLVHVPWLFDPNSYASPFDDPLDWLRSLLVPWLVAGLPLAAGCLRLTLATTIDALDEDYVRTGIAKGLSHRRVVRRHAAPAAYPTVASLVGASIPAVVTNIVLVEWVFAVPGFFRHTKRAIGQALPQTIDIPTLQALALWAAVLIVVTGLLADLALARLDPRIRASGRPPG